MEKRACHNYLVILLVGTLARGRSLANLTIDLHLPDIVVLILTTVQEVHDLDVPGHVARAVGGSQRWNSGTPLASTFVSRESRCNLKSSDLSQDGIPQTRRCRKTRQQLGPRKILVLSLVLWLNSLGKMSCARSLAARETLEALRVQMTVQCVSGTLLMNYMTRACPWRVTIPKLNARTHARRRPTNPLHRDLLELLLEAELVGVAALLLAAVHGAGVETSVAPEESGGGEKLEGERRVRDVQGHCRAEQM